MCRLAAEAGVPVTFLMLQTDDAPDDWRKHLELISRARAEGHDITAQVAGRPFGLLHGLTARHRFLDTQAFAPLVDLPVSEQVERMRDPELRGTLEVYYDCLLERDGQAIVMMMLLNYSYGNGDALHEMLNNDSAVLGLADGGAHCNMICDASTPTWMLTHWARDRTQGPKIPLPTVIKKLTADTAALFDFDDRGRLEVGLRADINVIDHENLTLREPHMVADLPAGGTRFVQGAEGYDYTIVAGEITRDHDAFTDARPGRLVRSE
ncbi:MAG: amidohydrolase family protein [Acidimicrobiales bacterium]|nr:amidohydrolase family protein [Acidimicrobiales bacterium]